MKQNKFSLIISLLLLSTSLKGQNSPNYFNNGDRICFIGNSITHVGTFHHNIALFYATRFPKQRIQIYNCGVSGDTGEGVIKRMDEDILVHKPTISIVMLGMNDVNRDLYSEKPANDPNIESLKSKALSDYKKNLEIIVQKLIANNSVVILEKPTIYDQTCKIPEKNHYGVNDALKVCSGYIQDIADKYKLTTIDYWTILSQINEKLQKDDPSATIIGSDRVHPGSSGHLVMAWQFLKTTHSPLTVSKISLSIKKNRTDKSALNCEISKLKHDKKQVRFSCYENSLPFPVDESSNKATELVPFMDEFNQELVQVTGLNEGTYALYIDTVKINSYSNTELGKGINLARVENTPQYKQALSVLNMYKKIWDIERSLRDIKFIEYGQLHIYDHPPSLQEVQGLSKKSLENGKDKPWYGYVKQQFDAYGTNKANEQKLMSEMAALQDSVYQLNRPVIHSFRIFKE
jgi:endoglucanase